jgi:hypothetical protein
MIDEESPVTIEQLRTRRAEIVAVAERHGASNLRIFGSVARGESADSSDIDFLARFQPDRSLFDWAALVRDLQMLLGTKVDVVSDRGLRERVRETIVRDAVPL